MKGQTNHTGKGGGFFGRKAAPEDLESALMRLSVHDAQNLLELLVDYLETPETWADVGKRGATCLWCQGAGKTANIIDHAKNCPITWLASNESLLTDKLYQLPRLRIGRGGPTRDVIYRYEERVTEEDDRGPRKGDVRVDI